MVQTFPDPWIDRVIDNRYRVVERIGRGGMGTVYKVVHTQMGKIAAMKLLHGSLARDKEQIKRFHREAEAISKLNHPNIVQVFDFGRVEESVYLVMEYLKGEDLGRILRRDGPLEVARCLPILVQVCDALTEAHSLQIIHRDLKPENVRVSRTQDGQDFVKVLDFGLAKMVQDEEEPDASITARGSLVGTPYYMAPEQIRAQPHDHRIDIYSLGAMTYRMLTAQNAFAAKTPMGVLTKHITEELVPPSHRAPEMDIPPELDAIVVRAMAKNPDERYSTAQEMKRDIVETQWKLQLQDSASIPPGPLSSLSSAPSLRRESDRVVVDRPEEDVGPPPTGLSVTTPALSVEPILSKEDLDFERKLRRGRRLWVLLLLPVLGLAGFLVYWYGLRSGEIYAPAEETEPNNTPDRATPLYRDKAITGHLGQRVSATESDRDWFRIQLDGPEPQTIRASVSRIPNMDITLELFDALAGRVAEADSSGRGGGETLSNWVVDPGRYFLLVREAWQVGVPPTENVTDSYRLVAQWQAREPGWELEPNDTPKQASRYRAGETLRGYLGTVADVDMFKVTTGKGFLAGMVTGVSGVDIMLEISTAPGAEPIAVDEEPAGGGEKFDGIRVQGTEDVQILIRRQNNRKALPGLEAQGTSEPYTFKTWLEPTGQ